MKHLVLPVSLTRLHTLLLEYFYLLSSSEGAGIVYVLKESLANNMWWVRTERRAGRQMEERNGEA